MKHFVKNVWLYFAAVTVSLLLATGCADQNSENLSAPVANQTENTFYSQDETLQELADFNASFQSEIPGTRGTDWVTWICVAANDAVGAYQGAKQGLKIGRILGPEGQIVCAAIGGTVKGTYKSYKTYTKLKKVAAKPKTRSTEDSDSLDLPSLEEVAAAYATVYTKVYDNDFKLADGWGIDNKTLRIGIMHNKSLDLIGHMSITAQTIALDELSDQERSVIENDEFIAGFYDDDTDLLNSDTLTRSSESQAYADNIMSLFINGIQNSVKTQKDINSFIIKYTAVVGKTNQLTDDEKETLYAGFAVMGYSFNYWSVKWPYEGESGDNGGDNGGDDDIILG